MLVEQFRPGVMERLGLGYAAVRKINPRIVYCSISGYGQEGPRAGEAGHDINYRRLTGLLALQPGPVEQPGRAAGAGRRHRRRHHAGGDQHPARPAPARRDRRGRLSRHRDDRRDVHLRLVRLCDRARDREISRARANCGSSAARRATSSIRRATASSSPAARWSRNSGSPSATRSGLPAPLMNDLADPAATKAADRGDHRARDRRALAAEIRRGRLLRHHHGVAGRGAARSAFRRARPVRASGGGRVGQDHAGAAGADRRTCAHSREASPARGNDRSRRASSCAAIFLAGNGATITRLLEHAIARTALRRASAAAAPRGSTPSRITRAAQRRDAVEQIEPEAARALHRQEIRQAGCG